MKGTLRQYYVRGCGCHGWYITEAHSPEEAYRDGTREFGRGNVRCVRLATEAEVAEFYRRGGATVREE